HQSVRGLQSCENGRVAHAAVGEALVRADSSLDGARRRRGAGRLMRGHVRKRGRTYSYWIELPNDPVSGARRQATKGGFRTKRECQDALTETLELVRTGRFVHQSSRTVRAFLVDEWLPSVRPPALLPSTWS